MSWVIFKAYCHDHFSGNFVILERKNCFVIKCIYMDLKTCHFFKLWFYYDFYCLKKKSSTVFIKVQFFSFSGMYYNSVEIAGYESSLQHVELNSVTGKWHCPICNRGYGRRDNMTWHFRHECQKPPRWKCPFCNLVSKKTSNVYQHIRGVHPNENVSVVRLYWFFNHQM